MRGGIASEGETPAPRAAAGRSRAPAWRQRAVGLRRTRIDAYRVYAVLVIIWAHCEFSLGAIPGFYRLLHHAMNIVGHAAMPLFFFIAGNHLGPTLVERPAFATVRGYVGRIGRLFLVWSAIYFVHGAFAAERDPHLLTMWGRHAQRLLSDPVTLLLAGTSLHLWFLVALMFAAVFSVAGLALGRLRLLAVLAATAYGVALAIGPYGHALGYLQIDGRRVTGLLQAPLFFAMGVVLSRRGSPPTRRVGWGLVAFGIALQGAETLALANAGLDPFQLGLLVGAVPLTAGFAVLALQPGATPVDRVASRVAALVPVAYLSHVIFLDLLRPQRHAFGPVVFRLLFPIAVAACAFGTAWLLRQSSARWRSVARLLSGGRSRRALS